MKKYDDTDYQIEREESIEYEEERNIDEDEKMIKGLEYELDKIIIKASKVETATEIVFLKQPIILMFLSLLKKQEKAKLIIKNLESKLKEANNQLDLDYVDKNYISKQKVKEGLEDIEDYFDRLNGPDEDIEYIRNIKKNLLEDKQ